MDISKESLLEIKYILTFLRNQKYDFKVINEIINILRKDSILDNPIDVEITDENTPAYTIEGVIYFSDYMFIYAQKAISLYKNFSNYNEYDAYNYMLLEIVLHEIAHLSQLDIALKRKSKYDVINDLYYLVLFGGYKDQEHYERNRLRYVHEYNANMEALKILKKLFEKNKFLEYLNNYQFKKLLDNYYITEKKIFIAEQTLDFRHVEDKSIISIHREVPTGILISNGLPIDYKSLNKLNIRPLERTRRKYNL